MIASVAVFCGSSVGARAEYAQAARALGSAAARRGIEVVYGGGNVGLMGVLADAALAAGGRVVGVIPRFLLDKELGHTGVTRLEVVESMHERKARMAELAEAFVALPGGLGTLEEICEATTWGLLGLHARPCALLDVAGYFAPFVATLDRAVEEGFLRPVHRGLVIVERDPEALLDRLAEAPPAAPPKWVQRT